MARLTEDERNLIGEDAEVAFQDAHPEYWYWHTVQQIEAVAKAREDAIAVASYDRALEDAVAVVWQKRVKENGQFFWSSTERTIEDIRSLSAHTEDQP